MGGDQGGHALGLDHGAEQAHDLLAGLGVELAGGLVGEQDLRAARQRPGDRDPLLLPAGQLTWPLLRVLAQADDVQHEPDALLPLLRVHAHDPQRHADVLRRRQDRDEAERLEDERHRRPAQPHPLVFRHGRHIAVRHPDATAVRQVEAADDVEQRGLPRPRPAAQRHQLAGRHGKGDAAQGPGGGVPAAEGPRDLLDGQHVYRGGHRGSSGFAGSWGLPGSRRSGQTHQPVAGDQRARAGIAVLPRRFRAQVRDAGPGGRPPDPPAGAWWPCESPYVLPAASQKAVSASPVSSPSGQEPTVRAG